jgi:hypothetical protein
VLVAQLLPALVQKGPQSVEISGAARRVAEGVQKQLDALEAQAGDEGGRQGHDLDVEAGVVGAEGLDPQLVVLAVAPGLGPLVAEVGRRVPGLPRKRGSVLHPRPHDRRRPLGAQGELVPALVGEVVHLLAHDVGALAHPGEHGHVLEHGADHQAVAGPPDRAREAADQRLPPRRLGRQHVMGAGRGTELGHGPEATGCPFSLRVSVRA